MQLQAKNSDLSSPRPPSHVAIRFTKRNLPPQVSSGSSKLCFSLFDQWRPLHHLQLLLIFEESNPDSSFPLNLVSPVFFPPENHSQSLPWRPKRRFYFLFLCFILLSMNTIDFMLAVEKIQGKKWKANVSVVYPIGNLSKKRLRSKYLTKTYHSLGR